LTNIFVSDIFTFLLKEIIVKKYFEINLHTTDGYVVLEASPANGFALRAKADGDTVHNSSLKLSRNDLEDLKRLIQFVLTETQDGFNYEVKQ
jgi:hypothetical protein